MLSWESYASAEGSSLIQTKSYYAKPSGFKARNSDRAEVHVKLFKYVVYRSGNYLVHSMLHLPLCNDPVTYAKDHLLSLDNGASKSSLLFSSGLSRCDSLQNITTRPTPSTPSCPPSSNGSHIPPNDTDTAASDILHASGRITSSSSLSQANPKKPR
jgi:hypothetical protein